MESLKLLQEIEAWLSFNQEPSKDELTKLQNDINSHVSEQLNKPDVSTRFMCHSCGTWHTGENDDQLHEICRDCFLHI